MAIPVQTAKDHINTGTSVAVVCASALTVGNLVVVTIALSGSTNVPSPTVSSVSLGTDALSLVGAVSNGSGSTGIRSEMWAGAVATASQTTATITVSAAANIEVVVAEYNGYTATLNGAAVTATGSSAAPATGNLTTTNATDLLVAGIASRNSTAGTTPTNSFTIENSEGLSGAGTGKNATGAANIDLLDITKSATGTYSTGDTITSAVWATVFAAFKAGTIVLIQETTASGTTGGPAPALSNTTAGNALILVYQGQSALPTSTPTVITGITDTQGNSWAKQIAVRSNTTPDVSDEIWAAFNIAGGAGANTVTVTTTGTTAGTHGYLSEWSGPVGALNVTNSATGTSTAPATGATGATANAIELAIAGFGATGTPTISAGPTTGFTQFTQPATIVTPLPGAAHRITAATGTFSTDWTISASNNWGAAIAVFKAAPVASNAARPKDIRRSHRPPNTLPGHRTLVNHGPLMRLRDTIQPPVALLGVRPEDIYARQIRHPRVHSVPSKPPLINHGALHKFRELIQPPSAALGFPPKELIHHRIPKPNFSPKPLRLKTGNIRWREFMSVVISAATGVVPKMLKRRLARPPVRPSAPKINKVLARVREIALAPIGVPLKLLRRARKRVAIQPRTQQASRGAIARLKRTIQPPAAALGVKPKQVLRKGARVTRVKFRALARSTKLERLIQPAASALGILPKMLRRRVTKPRAAQTQVSRRRRLPVALRTATVLFAALPKMLRRRLKTTQPKTIHAIRSDVARIARFGQPAAAASGLKPSQLRRKPAKARPTRPKASVRTALARIKTDIQPPSSALGVLPKMLKHRAAKATPIRPTSKRRRGLGSRLGAIIVTPFGIVPRMLKRRAPKMTVARPAATRRRDFMARIGAALAPIGVIPKMLRRRAATVASRPAATRRSGLGARLVGLIAAVPTGLRPRDFRRARRQQKPAILLAKRSNLLVRSIRRFLSLIIQGPVETIHLVMVLSPELDRTLALSNAISLTAHLSAELDATLALTAGQDMTLVLTKELDIIVRGE